MTSTNCKCLQKCSLASLGRSAEIKGHVCPACCLFVYLFVVVSLFNILHMTRGVFFPPAL